MNAPKVVLELHTPEPKAAVKEDPFTQLDQREAKRLAFMFFRKELSGTDLALVFYFLSLSGYQNVVYVEQKEIAEQYGIPKATVSRSIKALKEVGFLVEADARSGRYVINDFMAWKGTRAQLRRHTTKKIEKASKNLLSHTTKEER